MAKKDDRKGGRKGRKARAKNDRALLELGEDLLTAVHLHHAIQDDEVRAAAAAAHADLVQAAGDLVARIAGRFLDEAGGGRDRYARWAAQETVPVADEVGVIGPGDGGAPSH